MSRKPQVVSSRTDKIRKYATHMRALLDQRNYINVQIRDLHALIRKETGIPREDFISAMRLQALALQNREQSVANIRDVLTALGNIGPVIALTEDTASPHEELT